MANNLGTLSGALILQEALRLTFLKFPPLKTISMGLREKDGKVDNALLGQTVYTRTKQLLTVGNFGDAAANADTTDVPVTLTDHKQILVNFTTQQYNSTDRNLIAEQAEPIAITLAKAIVGYCASQWTIGNYAVIPKLVLGAGWDYTNTDLVLKGKLDNAGVPDMGDRFFAYNSAVEISRLADPLIVAALNNPSNGDAIRQGRLPEVAGLKQAPYYGINADTGGLTVIGVAGTPDATVYAARAPKNPEELLDMGPKFPGVIGYIEEPVTGFRVMVEQWIDLQMGLNTRLHWLQGFAVGNANNLCLLTNA